MAIAENRGESQAEVIALALAALDMQTAQGRVESLPRKSKKARHVEALKASDPLGADRPEIEYGSAELPSSGSVGVVGAAVPIQKAAPSKSMVDWRADRKPLLRPGEK